MHLRTEDEQPHTGARRVSSFGTGRPADERGGGWWPSVKGPGSALTLHLNGAMASDFWPLTVRDAEPAGSHGSSDQRGS